MATSLFGYGPFAIITNDDFDLKAVGSETRPQLLTLGLEFGTFDGTVTVKTRRQGSSDTFVTQSYVKPDLTGAATAISANTVVQVDATGKDVRITTAARSTGTLTVGLHLSDEL